VTGASGKNAKKSRAKAQRGLDFDAVRRLAFLLPDVEDGMSYGTRALKVKGKLFVRLKEDPSIIVLRMPFEQREGLVSEDPDTYFITDHYLNYEWVLVRLAKVSEAALRELLQVAHRAATKAKSTRS
jgi:hypothetical protein